MSVDAGTVRRPAFRSPSVESLAVGALVLFGFRLGLAGIADNSSFVHIRTGIEMWRRHAIFRADPYSFTAHGHPWVVQSWFASAIYGAAYEIAGLHLVVIVNGLVAAIVAWTVARLARTGSMVRTAATACIAVLGGALYWAPRPLMFGLLCLALTITVVERRARGWWLLPIGWVWVNTHGSFPLGLAWIVAVAVGEAIDTRARPRWAQRYVAWFIGGLAVGAINPLGPRLLTFPLAVRDKASVFKNVVEWRSPDFQTLQGFATLLFLAVALLILMRGRLRWSDVLPVVGFVAFGLFSVRNMAPAAVVMAPALARAMAPRRTSDDRPDAAGPVEPSVSRPPVLAGRNAGRARLNTAIAGLLVLVAVLFVAGAQHASALDLRTYPTKAEAWMQHEGLLDPVQHHVASQDIIGCYLILVRGTKGQVFIDDRVDMYPVAVSNDYDALLHGSPDSLTILNRYHVDVVLWDRRLALVELLQNSGDWRLVYPTPGAPTKSANDARWVVLVRDSVSLPE